MRTKHALSTPGLANETGGYARDLALAVAWEPVAQLLKEQTVHMLINAAKRLSEIIRKSNGWWERWSFSLVRALGQ